jgi:hypothetical protein
VKGHQDQGRHYLSLPREAQLNVEMDKTVAAYWTHLMMTTEDLYPEAHDIYEEEWQLWDRAVEKNHPAFKKQPLLNHAKLPYKHVVGQKWASTTRMSKLYRLRGHSTSNEINSSVSSPVCNQSGVRKLRGWENSGRIEVCKETYMPEVNAGRDNGPCAKM